MLAVKDVSSLLVNVPRGAWVALSKDQDKLVAYAAELEEVLQKAKEAGEENPIVMRVPEADSATLFV